MTYSSEDQLDRRREEDEAAAAAAASTPTRKSLDSDEWIAILVAFGVIGTIFFWSIRPQTAANGGGGWLSGNGMGLVGDGEGDAAGSGLLPETGGAEAIAEVAPALLGEEGSKLTSPSSTLGAALEDEDKTGLLNRRNAGAAAVAGAAAAGAAASGATAEPIPVPAVPAESPEPAVEANSASPPLEEAPSDAAQEPSDSAQAPAEAPPLAVASEDLDTSVPEIPADAWVAPFADSLVAAERFGELPTQTSGFDIDQPVTRAEFAALLNQAEQANGDPAAAAGEFADIDESFWGASGIAGANATGFMSGYSTPDGDLAFRPAEEIPRWQVFVTLASGLNLSIPADPDTVLSSYDITGVPDWAKGQVAATVQEGLAINPNSTTDLEALRSTTRGEATAMIQQVLQRENKVEAVDASAFVVNVTE